MGYSGCFIFIFFHCIHCSPGILACCRPARPSHYNSKKNYIIASFQDIILEDFRGDTTVPCSACHRVILAMPKSLTLHRVIPFGPSPSPLPINWSEFSLLLPQASFFFMSALSRHTGSESNQQEGFGFFFFFF